MWRLDVPSSTPSSALYRVSLVSPTDYIERRRDGRFRKARKNEDKDAGDQQVKENHRKCHRILPVGKEKEKCPIHHVLLGARKKGGGKKMK